MEQKRENYVPKWFPQEFNFQLSADEKIKIF
jgi:hypothetical protein